MKRILSIFMIVLTVFLMVLPATAVDGEGEDVEEWEDIIDTDMLEVDESIEPFDLICYDPLINYLNDKDNGEVPMDECAEAEENGSVSPYVIVKPEDEDITLELDKLLSDTINDENDGEHFKNIVNVNIEGQQRKNRSYLYSLVKSRFSDYSFEGELYMNLQGSCSDGEYIYYAFFIGDSYDIIYNGEEKNIKKPLEVCIVSGKFNENNEFITSAMRFAGDMIQEGCLTNRDDLKHANDITYNSLYDKLIVSCSDMGYHNLVYSMDAAYFRGETEILPTVEKHELSCMITSIAYNEKRNKYVATLGATDMYFIYFDCDFNLIAGFNSISTFSENTLLEEEYKVDLHRQGICCDDNYIYATYCKAPESNLRNVIVVFDWEGNRLAEINLNTPIDDKYARVPAFEIEGISILNDRIVLGFNVFWRKLGENGGRIAYFYQYDMSHLCFNIKYCPDDNVESYVNANDMRSNNVIYGNQTKLLDNTYMKYGHKFVGWHLYSPRNGKWRYWKDVEASDKDLYGWFVPGTQPEGYEKIVYKEDVSVKQTVPAGWDLLLCAVWEDTNEFYVSYNANDNGSGIIAKEMDDQVMIYGQSNDLTVNKFTKTVNGSPVDFLGWNPYSPEVNKWYYENADKSQRGWYTEGEEPTGFTKVLYANGGSVRQTTKPGGHIILFAVWDEFTIYYDAGGKLIKPGSVLFPTVVHKNYRSDILKYSPSSIFTYDTTIYESNNHTYPNSFEGYYQYHVESKRWRYVRNDDTTVWLSSSNDLPKYIYKGSKIKNGLTAGQRVVFSAAWS